MQDKTIGIITFQKNISSFGASLQAHATCKFLEKEGFCPVMIDLRSHENILYKRSKNHETISQKHRLSCIKGRIIYYLKNPLKIYRFWKFNKKIKYSRPYYSVDQLFNAPPKFDVYCTGSDQTLNPRLTISPDAFLLGFTNGKKISYSSSVGEIYVPDRFAEIYKTLLAQYNHISVREQKSKELIEGYCNNLNVDLTLDPTLLLPSEYYRDLCKINTHKEDYILFFSLHPNKKNLTYAERIARKNNLKLIVVGKKCKDINAEFVSDIGPREWLGYISEASHILTDSFHGTIFSLLLNNNFMSIVPKSGGSRIPYLLETFGIERNMTSIEDSIEYNIKDTEFNRVDFENNLMDKRAFSRKWFINALNN